MIQEMRNIGYCHLVCLDPDHHSQLVLMPWPPHQHLCPAVSPLALVQDICEDLLQIFQLERSHLLFSREKLNIICKKFTVAYRQIV